MIVKPATQQIRPYVACAVLRGVKFTQENYDSFIDLQDKLHNNIARKRTLVAIGTHDLSTIEGPFTYDAQSPSDISFVPLTQKKVFRADELMDFYRTDASVKHIKPYVDIISSSPVYPIIRDKNNVVLSLPPIINGEHSKITLNTTDVFIECTGTDLTKVNIVLNIVVTMFSEYCSSKFEVEPVSVLYEATTHNVPNSGSGEVVITPDLSNHVMTASMNRLTSTVGAKIESNVAASLATRMGLEARVISPKEITHIPEGVTIDNCDYLEVIVPPTRSDVIHECDIIEDIAISYGYNNITRTLPKTVTSGSSQLYINKLSDKLRREMAMGGFDECLTLALCSRDENFSHLLLEDNGNEAVVIANPKTEEFQIGRTNMYPGLLKSLQANRAAPMRDGVRLFEISDVILLDDSADVGARNERRLGAIYAGPHSCFEIIHGLLDRVMMLLEIPHRPFSWEDAATKEKGATYPAYYYIEEDPTIPTFFKGRGCKVIFARRNLSTGEVSETKIGFFGLLKPEVLNNFEISWPVAVLELNIEVF
jgi:phenylalanyl-tRNA synthetase beta chain